MKMLNSPRCRLHSVFIQESAFKASWVAVLSVTLLSASTLNEISALERRVYLKLVSRFTCVCRTSRVTCTTRWYLGYGRSNVRLTKQATNIAQYFQPAHVRCNLLDWGHPSATGTWFCPEIQTAGMTVQTLSGLHFDPAATVQDSSLLALTCFRFFFVFFFGMACTVSRGCILDKIFQFLQLIVFLFTRVSSPKRFGALCASSGTATLFRSDFNTHSLIVHQNQVWWIIREVVLKVSSDDGAHRAPKCVGLEKSVETETKSQCTV
jgi:hypothetical protein